jgi:serine/threonine-protein kinase
VSQSPATIGRFKVINRIGRGGMGSLYLAWDPVLERQIAIKLLRDDSDELRERFAREARSVARLRHPKIRRAWWRERVSEIVRTSLKAGV